MTYEARLNTINDANEAKSNLKNEIKKDKYKYADGTSPDWDAVVAYYDNAIKKSKEAQVADWTAKVQEHVNFDVNSSSNVEELEQHVNGLNALNAEITSDDAREYILNDYKDDGTTLENTIQEQVARYQARIEAVKQEQKKAEEERQAAAAAASKKKKSNNYSSGGSSSSSSSNGGDSSSNSGSSSGGKVVISWMDFYDEKMMKWIEENVESSQKLGIKSRFEITETSFEAMKQNRNNILESLQKKGAVTLLDDFGSGYSSYGVLQDYNFDILKIDMSLVRQIETNPKSRSCLLYTSPSPRD